MTIRYVFIALAFLFVPGALAAEPPALADKLVSCGKCHAGKLALTGRPAEEVLAGIHRIREGKRAHPPGLQIFEAEQLAEVAAILSGATSVESVR